MNRIYILYSKNNHLVVSLKNYCRCGIHCKKYGMNAFYCRKIFLRNPCLYPYIPEKKDLIHKKKPPKELEKFVQDIKRYKEQIGRMSFLVIHRRLKVTIEMAKKIMEFI